MRLPGPLLLVLACLLGPARASHADVVVTTDGKRYEGEVVSQDDAEVVIETTFAGRKAIPRARVAQVDTGTPPLRSQLAYRLQEAGEDHASLWVVHKWAKAQGFGKELEEILERIVAVRPGDTRARRLLGHERVDGTWMSPAEKAELAQRRHEEAMRAKGLVPHEGEWVTPEEKEAREKGLMKDGDEWVTEETYRRRRGERLVDGRWVRLGEERGKALGQEIAVGARLRLEHLWTPHFDVHHEADPEGAKKVAAGAEAAYAKAREVLRFEGRDLPEEVEDRIQLVLLARQAGYSRVAQWFDGKEKASELVPGWLRAVQRQHGFWWAHPMPITAVYKFPNTDATFVSNVVHNVGLILLTRYRFNFRFPSTWLQEGFSYFLETETLGYSDSFTVGRGAGTGAAPGQPLVWADSNKWRGALQGLVAEERDPPLRRLATMGYDQLGLIELVKAWSVVECLVRWDRARFEAFVDASKERGAEEEEALRKAFGVGYRELDVRWREYVRAGFRNP